MRSAEGTLIGWWCIDGGSSRLGRTAGTKWRRARLLIRLHIITMYPSTVVLEPCPQVSQNQTSGQTVSCRVIIISYKRHPSRTTSTSTFSIPSSGYMFGENAVSMAQRSILVYGSAVFHSAAISMPKAIYASSSFPFSTSGSGELQIGKLRCR